MSPEAEDQSAFRIAQLIPYLGNKRSLLPSLGPLFHSLVQPEPGARFLDPFMGSGSVARMARSMGYQVYANDWEPYALALARCWLVLRPTDIHSAFSGQAESVYEHWNRMHPLDPRCDVQPLAEGPEYFSRYYAPACTEAPVLGKERMFYTAENARFLDRVRYRLDAEYPASGDCSAARDALLGSLIVEAATHANTSGVFKAYHRGFGGHSGNALSRIKGRMELEVPQLPDAQAAVLGNEDAARFCARASVDLAYLDPPYNQHQYGSNYHILNTLVRWDGWNPGMELGPDDSLVDKAGIPARWRDTRSAYCMKATAKSAIKELVASVDAAFIVLSWNGEGHVDEREMVELLCERGRVDLHALEYTAYRGGRQSADRQALTREYLYVVDTRAQPVPSSKLLAQLENLTALDTVARGRYDRRKLQSYFSMTPTGPDIGDGRVFALGKLASPAAGAMELLAQLSDAQRDKAIAGLRASVCGTASEHLEVLHSVVSVPGSRASARQETLRWLRKLAHRKHRDEFASWMERMHAIAQNDRVFMRGLAALELLAAKRFGYRRS